MLEKDIEIKDKMHVTPFIVQIINLQPHNVDPQRSFSLLIETPCELHQHYMRSDNTYTPRCSETTQCTLYNLPSRLSGIHYLRLPKEGLSNETIFLVRDSTRCVCVQGCSQDIAWRLEENQNACVILTLVFDESSAMKHGKVMFLQPHHIPIPIAPVIFATFAETKALNHIEFQNAIQGFKSVPQYKEFESRVKSHLFTNEWFGQFDIDHIPPPSIEDSFIVQTLYDAALLSPQVKNADVLEHIRNQLKHEHWTESTEILYLSLLCVLGSSDSSRLARENLILLHSVRTLRSTQNLKDKFTYPLPAKRVMLMYKLHTELESHFEL